MENLNKQHISQTQEQLPEQTNVYGYIRVSTSTQVYDGFGLETQKNAITKYCEANNLNLIHIFSDEGISGAMGDEDDLTKRKGISDLLSNLDEECNTIVVLNKSRLWRDDMARAIISKTIRKSQGNIISIEEPNYSLYSTDPSEYLYNAIMEALDVYSRLEINMKLSKGRQTKASKGTKPCGNLPYGYKYTNDKKDIVIDEQESKVVKMIFELASKGNGFQSISNTVNKLGIITKRGNEWTRTSVRNILKNDFYIGVLTYNEKIKGNHPAIIREDVWLNVNNEI